MQDEQQFERFNLQSFLSEMREEGRESADRLERLQRESHTQLGKKMDDISSTVQGHETRLVVVENTRKTARWFVAAVVTAMVSAGVAYAIGR